MRNKKGQVSDQFNWIFAIIIGGVILLFFLFVLGQVKDAADMKLAVTVLNNFDAILTGSAVTPNSLNLIDSTKLLEFEVSCDGDGLSELTIDGFSKGIDLSQRVLFSPHVATGQRLYLYVLPIERPFDLGSAMFLTGDNVFFGTYKSSESPGLDAIYDLLPNNISKEEVGFFNNDHKAFDKLIIFSDTDAPEMSNSYNNVEGQVNIKKKDVTWIKLKFNNDQAYMATVYKKGEKDDTFNPIGTVNIPSNEFALFLAFSKDINFYECNFNKINRKLKVVANIYLERVRYLLDDVTKTNCANKYLVAEEKLEQLISSDSGYSEDDLVDSLEEVNNGLLINSCPLVY